MANPYLRAHGATVQFASATAIADATVIGVPGDQYDLIEKPALSETRISYDLSDTPDSPEVTVTVPWATTVPAVGDTAMTITISLPKASKSVAFTGKVIAIRPGNAEVDGLLSKDVVIKPTSVVTVT